MSDNINVLVTSIGNIGVGNQILNALRLSNMNLTIIGTDVSDFNIPQKELDFFYKVSYAHSVNYEKEMLGIISKHNVNIVFVGSEQEYIYFSANRKIYNGMGVFLAINSSEMAKIGFNKFNTYNRLNKAGIKIPQYCKINDANDYKNITFYPAIIKPNINSSSSQNVFIDFDAQDAKGFIQYMLKLNIDTIAQEYVGDCYSEHTIEVTSDMKGHILGTFIIRRNFNSAISYKNKITKDKKDYLISSGITQGEVIHDEYIKEQAEEIARVLGSKGPLNIQAMFVNQELLTIEVHPMITGSVYIRALAGYNEPENIIKKEILNENVTYEYRNLKVVRKLVNKIYEEEEKNDQIM